MTQLRRRPLTCPPRPWWKQPRGRGGNGSRRETKLVQRQGLTFGNGSDLQVAELLGGASQEVLALLKSDHGIELKSASSTLEEVVARSFVERVARQRNIDVPGGDMFSDKATAKAKGGKGWQEGRARKEGRAAQADRASAGSAAARQDDQASNPAARRGDGGRGRRRRRLRTWRGHVTTAQKPRNR